MSILRLIGRRQMVMHVRQPVDRRWCDSTVDYVPESPGKAVISIFPVDQTPLDRVTRAHRLLQSA